MLIKRDHLCSTAAQKRMAQMPKAKNKNRRRKKTRKISVPVFLLTPSALHQWTARTRFRFRHNFSERPSLQKCKDERFLQLLYLPWWCALKQDQSETIHLQTSNLFQSSKPLLKFSRKRTLVYLLSRRWQMDTKKAKLIWVKRNVATLIGLVVIIISRKRQKATTK